MNWTNYHSHTHYCDGKMPPEDYILEAMKQGVSIYGFSSHCPVPFENEWSVKESDLPAYLNEIDTLKIKYSGQIELYKSLEIDFIPGLISVNSEIIKSARLDYTIGSVHFINQFPNGDWWEIDGSISRFKEGLTTIYKNDIQKAVSDYFLQIRQMVEEACPDIIGHIDKIKMHNGKEFFFDENEAWYKREMQKTLEVVRASGAIIEVNTRGMYKKYCEEPYPGSGFLKEILHMNIPVCINSDSHHITEITKGFTEAASLLQSIGFKQLRIYKNNEWTDVNFDDKRLYF